MINKVSSECRTYTQQEVDNIIENYRYENAQLKAEINKLKIKHWKVSDNFYHDSDGYGIYIDGVLSICIDDGKVRFTELCDSHFFKHMTKQEAIECLKEAIQWVEDNG